MNNINFPRKSKRSGQIWERLPSSVVVPTANITDSIEVSKTNFVEIKNRANEIEQIFKEAGVRLPLNSGLGKLLNNARSLCDNWLLCNQEKLSYEMMFLGMHLDRIADPILLLKDEPEKSTHLNELLSGTLDFFKREKSNSKNYFWEFEVWAKIKKRMKDVFLSEPPDIVVNYVNSRIGIACKKLYSEKHVQNVLSQAVKQIETEFEFGIVALNLDDLLPPDVVLKMESSEAVSEKLNQINAKFINRHNRHFIKYLSASRIISVIVSTSTVCDVPSEKPRFRNTYQWTVWTISGLPISHKEQLDNFYGTIMS